MVVACCCWGRNAGGRGGVKEVTSFDVVSPMQRSNDCAWEFIVCAEYGPVLVEFSLVCLNHSMHAIKDCEWRRNGKDH